MTTAKGSKKNHKWEAAIAALISSPTIAHAAKSIGVSEQTLWRWLQEAEFQAEYRLVKRQMMNQSVNQMQAAMGEAVQTLRDVMRNKRYPGAQVQAAKIIMEYAYKGWEMEEFEARLAELERRAGITK